VRRIAVAVAAPDAVRGALPVAVGEAVRVALELPDGLGRTEGVEY